MKPIRILNPFASLLLFFQSGFLLHAQPATFSSTDTPAGSGQPYSLATGDFNNDGKPDFAIGSTASPYHITIFLGNGSGGFTISQTYTSSAPPLGLAAADVNRDGRVDLVYADNQTYRVLLGNGDGTFTAGPSHAVGSGISPQGVAVADFNGDGKLDIVTANFGSGDLSVYLGNGDGSFGVEQRFGAGTQCYSVIAGDFNNDGKLDLAAPNFGANTVSVLLGNGDGTFQGATNLTVGSGPVAAVAADFNTDGKLDLVVANFNGASLTVFIGNGDGTFLPAATYPVQIPSGIAVADYDGDGALDLAVARYSASEVAVLRGNGNGTFQSAADLTFSANSWPVAIVSADFNLDSRPDLVTTDFLSSNYSTLLNTTTFGPGLSVQPNIGSGTAQTFTFTFYDPSGASSIISAQMDISATLTSIGACNVSYSRSSNTVNLADDSGAAQPPLTVGVAGSEQNSQCILNAGASSAFASGNVLTVKLALTFKPAYAGSKAIFMQAQDSTQTIGFARRGSWIVPGGPSGSPDFSIGLSPGSQSVTQGGSTSYNVLVTGNNGFSGTVSLAATALPSGVNAVFNPPSITGSGSSSLTVNVAGSAPTGSFSIQVTGTSASLVHSASAALTIGSSSSPTPPTVQSVSPNSGSGSAQTFTFMFTDPAGATNIVSTQMDINASLAAAGSCYLFFSRGINTIYLADDSGAFHTGQTIGNAGTQQNSQCILNAGASSVSMSGNTLTVNLALSFMSSFAGAKSVFGEAQNASADSGWSQLGTFTVTTTPNPQADFSIGISPSSQTVGAGNSTAYTVTITSINGFTGTVTFSTEPLPSGATATFNPTSVTGSGSTTMTISTASNASLGNFSIAARGTSGALNHEATASLIINSGGSSSPPSVVSVSPNAGSGSTQTFTFTFSDPAGAANIVSTQMDIGPNLAAAGTCYFYYSRGLNAIYLANDAGSFGSPLTIGSAGTEQNSQCSVDSGASSSNMSGNTLTVALAVTFKPTFAGSTKIFAEAQNGSLDSGWSQVGTWTVTTGSSSQPDFSLVVAPSSQTVVAGNSTSYQVTVNPVNGFSGTVTLGVSSLPSGASGSFNPATVTSSGSSTLTINTTSSATVGSFAISINGTSGSLTHSVGATLNIAGSGGATPPSLVSVTPASGSGSAQTFTFTFSDSGGASNIVSTQMDIGATLAAAGSCYFYYSRGTNGIYLANDSGAFGSPLTVGSAGTAQNSQCTVDSGASSSSMSGNTLMVSLAITFKPAFAGAKGVFMEAQNSALDSGWAQLGSWTVTTSSGPQPDFTINLSPFSQSVAAGNSTAYTVTVNPINGFNGTVSFSMSPLPAGASGSFNPTTVTGSGSTTLTVTTTNSATPGNYAIDITGTSGVLSHDAPGSLVIASGSATPPTAVSVTPSSGSGASQTFAFLFTDSNGASDIVSAQMDIGTTLAAAGTCYLYYSRPANAIYLANDSGSFSGGSTVGLTGSQQNSQCIVDAGASSVMLSGNNLTLNLALTFKQPAFSGAKNVFMEVQNSTFDSGWSQRGTWTVP